MCDGCGEHVTRWTYATGGPWAGKWICQECSTRGKDLKKLSRAVYFRFRLAEIFPPKDLMTVPLIRLMMAVDDVRRAQNQLIDASVQLAHAPEFEKYLPLGDHLYAMRRLYSHLHEAGRALRALDAAAKPRVDAALANNPEALAALNRIRAFFNADEYKTSFVSRIRNTIGFHYDHSEVAKLVDKYFTKKAIGGATAAEVGGLGRMVDAFVLRVLVDLSGGDLLAPAGGTSQRRIKEATALVGKLMTVVDELFESLIAQSPDAVIEWQEGVVRIPGYLWETRGRSRNRRGAP